MADSTLDLERLLKLRLVVARFGEMDLAKWWNTKGQLGRLGAALRRGLPRTHHFAQARSRVRGRGAPLRRGVRSPWVRDAVATPRETSRRSSTRDGSTGSTTRPTGRRSSTSSRRSKAPDLVAALRSFDLIE